MKNIYLFGTNILTQMLIHSIKNTSTYNLLGATVNKKHYKEPEFCGIPVIPFEDLALDEGIMELNLVNCVGFSEHMNIRASVDSFLRSRQKVRLLSYIHPNASINDADFGESNIIMNNVIIEPNSEIGIGNVFYGGSYICHNAKIGNYNWFSAGCVLAGYVSVGNKNFIGVNSCIRNQIDIGSNNTVGMGAVVVKNVKSGAIVFGNPAVEKD